MRRFLVILLAVLVAGLLLAPAAGAVKDPITVVGPFGVGSPEGDALEAELEALYPNVIYEQYFGIVDLVGRVEGADPPDLIIVPQPGRLIELAPYLVDLSRVMSDKALRQFFGDYLVDLVTVDGAVLGAPIKADLKSLVWYRPAEFEANGYAIPETFTELVALSDQMVANGEQPWCNYIESGFATGWLGTDWIEDLLLSTEGPAVYDEWVDHDILFTDPRVEAAFDRFMQMMDTDGYVFDRTNMTNITFPFNAEPLGLGDCLMHRQATFFGFHINDFGFDIGDFATFKFPSVNPPFGDAAVGGGVFMAAVSHDPEVLNLARRMMLPSFGRNALAATGWWLMPNVKFSTKFYADDLTRSWGEIIQAAIEADQFRFDASDLMPTVVGAGEFWFAIRDLVDGVRFLPGILTDIDAAWPI